MVPHPQLRPRQVPQRAPTRPATTPTGGLTLHAKVEPTPHRLKLFGSNCRIWVEARGDDSGADPAPRQQTPAHRTAVERAGRSRRWTPVARTLPRLVWPA